MPSPFPGMDPYIERAAIWPDFHDRLVTYLCGSLQPLLRPKYAALMQDLEADTAAVFEMNEEEIRQPYIEIIEPAAGNRIVTAIEVLSPTNKTRGEGLDSYVRKRQELWSAGANLVEIDLLRAGAKTVRVSEQRLAELRPWHYVVAVTRRKPRWEEIYKIQLDARLPRIGVPLSPGDNDAVIDLQAVFNRCWDEGAYPELLNYDEPPPGTLSEAEISWCETLAKGYLGQQEL